MFVACVVLLAAGTGFVLRQTGVAKSFVQRVLARVIASPFALDRADVDLGGGTLTLTDLQITHPVDQTRSLLRAKDIRVSMNTNPLGEVGRVNKVVLRGLRIDDLAVTGPSALRLDDVFKMASDSSTSAATYPAIVIEDASVGLRFSDTAPPLRFSNVDLELLPLDGPGSQMVLSGSMTTPMGTRVSVTGQGDVRTHCFRVLAKAAGLNLTPAGAEPFSLEVARALTAADLSGHIASAQLWLESQDGSTLRGGFQAELDDLTFCPPQFPRRLTGTAKIVGSLQDQGSVNVQFESRSERGAVKLEGSVQQLFAPMVEATLALTLQGLRVDDELLRAVTAQPAGARLLAAFTPAASGEVDGEARLVIREHALQVAVDAELRGLSASFQGFQPGQRGTSFPYPLRDVGGRVQVRDSAVTLDGLRGRDARQGDVEVTGKVPFDLRTERGHVTIRGRGIAFSDELRAALLALDPRAAKHYDDCDPAGTADVEVRVTDIGAEHTGLYVLIEPLGATAAHAVFPCRVAAIAGRVEIDERTVRLDLTGERAGKAVAVRGRFHSKPQTTDETGLHAELRVTAEDLLLDDELRSALQTLAPTTNALWSKLAPRGRVAADIVTWEPAPQAGYGYQVRLDVLDGQVLPTAFPVELSQLHGPIFVQGDGNGSRVDVHLLRGRAQQGDDDPALVFVSGVMRREALTEAEIDLTTIARGVVLRPQLRDVLEATGTLSRAAWDMMSPTGQVDVITRHQSRGVDAPLHTHLRVQLRDVGVNASFLPAPASKLNGEIEAADNRATATELRGLLGAAPVIIRDGEVSHGDGASRVRGVLTADELPVNDDLARLFGNSPLREAYLRRQVRGHAKVTALNIDCTVPDAPDSGFSLLASGQMMLRDCALTLAVPVEHVDGVLTLQECRVDASTGQIEGALTNVSAQVLGRTLQDVSAGFHADANEIIFRDLSLRLHGGRVVGTDDGPHLRYETAGEGSVSANLSWQGVRLSELTSGVGRGASTTGLTGNLAGRLALDRLPGTRIIDAVGHGEVHVSAGRLGDVPLFRTIYAILRRQPQFTSADATFRVDKRRIDIDRLTLGSQILEVKGKGAVTMDGYVDMTIELPDLFGDAADFLILPQILHNAVSQVLEFKLHGYLRDPEVTPLTPFQSTPARRSLDPIPARLPDLPRNRF